MSSRSTYEFRSAAVRSAASQPRVTYAPVVSICDSPAYTRAGRSQASQPDGDGLNCVRGICSAFVLEFGLALLGYGIWHLLRLVH